MPVRSNDTKTTKAAANAAPTAGVMKAAPKPAGKAEAKSAPKAAPKAAAKASTVKAATSTTRRPKPDAKLTGKPDTPISSKAVVDVATKSKPAQVAVDGKAGDVTVRKTSGLPAARPKNAAVKPMAATSGPPKSGLARPRPKLAGGARGKRG